MPFNSHTASLSGKKSKRGKSKLTPDIQDRLDFLAAENLDYHLSHLDKLNTSDLTDLLNMHIKYLRITISRKPLN